ncbi:DNA-directed RNA polymerase I subunit RPA12 [Blattella germanica]|nr:DNA-directed RNA polymerase I subunit RPA12 [Blattella germanica]
MEKKVSSEPGFCPKCGTILPLLTMSGNVTCYNCGKSYGPEVYQGLEYEYVIHFNSMDTYQDAKENKDAAEGPVVDRKCPSCGNKKMSYATLQLRSADEGQTVFYTCTKCKFKETENS